VRLFFLLYLGLSPMASIPRQNPLELAQYQPVPQDDDRYIPYPYDQGILPPRQLQKTLPPLTRKEKVIWAFRTARSSIFQ